MTFVESYKNFWKKYVDFNSTAKLSEFWLANGMHFLLFSFVYFLIEANIYLSERSDLFVFEFFLGFLSIVFFMFLFATFLPTISSGWRRLHDAGLSGAFLLLLLIPYVGFIAVIILLCLPTKTENNIYIKKATSQTNQDNSLQLSHKPAQDLKTQLQRAKEMFDRQIINTEEYMLLKDQIIKKHIENN